MLDYAEYLLQVHKQWARIVPLSRRLHFGIQSSDSIGESLK